MSSHTDNKTEKATAKKRKDAREQGQVLKSTEVNTAFGAIVMLGLMLIIWPRYTNQLTGIFTDFLGPSAMDATNHEISIRMVVELFRKAVLSMATILLPILGIAMLAGLISNIGQTGFLFTTKTLQPKLERISPIKGFKRIFSLRTLVELLKSLLKISLLGFVLYTEYTKLITKFTHFLGMDVYGAFLEIMDIALSIALKMSIVLGIIAAFDYLYQWWKYEKELMMTKQEVKDEYKLLEGDPQIKSRIRQKQRQMSAMRMMERVPSADVVITNPTHYAIALKYEEGVDNAPIVIAKGLDYLARKIKEVARENKIEIVENKPLAQALYNLCEIDDEIPVEFYQAVADILVYVYRRKNLRREGSR